MYLCPKCGIALADDDIGIYRKLINKTSPGNDCLCRGCLAAHFHCEKSVIEEKIRQFKEAGCTLFCLDGGKGSK